ncbi:MAG: entericidin [Bacteroidaceae bacterium]|nr:entericidin [Bacteroidaceae bacterium]
MKKLVFAVVAAVALTASVSFVSCDAKDVAALDSLANALDSAAAVLDSAANAIDSIAGDSINADSVK